jgi:hypothetical protein
VIKELNGLRSARRYIFKLEVQSRSPLPRGIEVKEEIKRSPANVVILGSLRAEVIKSLKKV